jgi:hypothetical protein
LASPLHGRGGRLPLAFGLVIVANDLVWWPAFVTYLRRYPLSV